MTFIIHLLTISDLLLADEEVLVVVDVVVLRVLHPHPEGLGAPVHAVVPPEVGRHRQPHAEHGPRYGLQANDRYDDVEL